MGKENQILSRYYIGIYIMELFYFFSQGFSQFPTGVNDNDGNEILGLQVFYGTPKAGFRSAMKKFNNRIVLPMLNFYSFDAEREVVYERPVYYYDPDSFNPDDHTIAYTLCPGHYKVSFHFNLWTDTNQDSDEIIHRIIQKFPMGETSLIYFPDYDPIKWAKEKKKDPLFVPPEIDKTNFLLMPMKLEAGFANETEIEGLAPSETKDKHKTTFQIMADVKVPHEVKIAQTIQEITTSLEQPGEVNTILEDFNIVNI